MVHLVVHLVRDVRFRGPVYLRWMYHVERYMKILKGYVKKHYYPEALKIERYIKKVLNLVQSTCQKQIQ